MRGFEIAKGFEKLAVIPRRQTLKSSGYDICAVVAEPTYIFPGETLAIETGITAYMRDDEELQIRPRSGLAFKNNVYLANFGTIDADFYPNPIKVLLKNDGDQPFKIEQGMRIAQGVFAKVLQAEHDDPVSQERVGGFGSTGM